MFFEGFFANENPPTSIEKQDLISEMLVAMVWADGHAHSAQLQRIIHILARWFHVGEGQVRKKISGVRHRWFVAPVPAG